jgi:predicted RNase H-like HicB family nuclease
VKHKYSIVIQWSDEDNAFLVTLPEFSRDPQTHGDTYKEAVKRAQEVLETLIEFYQDEGRPLPKPRKHRAKRQTASA